MNIKKLAFSRTLASALVIAVQLGLTATSQQAQAANPQFIILGTGGVTGVYYPTGGTICRLINKKRKETGIRCSVESTQGSIANLNNISDAALDLAIAQSDSQYHAYNGSGIFENLGPNINLRSVFTLYAEPFTIVARKTSGIKTFNDLAGKRVNIGNPGSGHRETMDMLMRTKGWSKNSFSLASELNSVEQARALCDNQIDAFVFSVAHPAGSLKEATNNCDTVIVSVDGPVVDQLISDNSFYHKTVVPGGLYRGNDRDVITLGVNASLIASSRTDEETIYLVAKNVFENLDTMKKMHPAFRNLSHESMAKRNNNIPTHDGAAKYFREIGLYTN